MKLLYLLTITLFLNYTCLNAQKTDVITGLNFPVGLAKNGNELYVSEYTGKKISKIDLTAETPTATDVVTGLSTPTGLVINGNDLYVGEGNGGKISKIDLTAETPTATDALTGLGSPWLLIIEDNIMYIADAGGGEISKVDLAALSIDDIYLKTLQTHIAPNPAQDFIQVFDVKDKENYAIYNVLGTEIVTGSVSDKQKIDISKFTNGVYFLKLQNENSLKFIKE